ncbi:hypothetical protein OG786_29050 [Streptomyces sp. NBC_00101]|uniref:hypothetical protein n=1 Tax=Streptomyces sp. NBC_00101 TaxID=2975651 RepID=UPI0032453D74
MSTINSRLLASAIKDATTALRTAEDIDVSDDLALARSHATLTAELSRLLWALDDANETAEAAARVPAQVAAEDGVRWIGVPYQRESVAA